jgi:hypothetical protein
MVFLRNLLLVLVAALFMMYLLLLSFLLNGVVAQDVFTELLQLLLRGQLIGLIIGVIINFGALLPMYRKKEWDLHIVVPQALFYIVIEGIILVIVLFFVQSPALFETALISGFLIGSLVPVLAYSGEVRKEHSPDVVV